jgi:hypothetical protein
MRLTWKKCFLVSVFLNAQINAQSLSDTKLGRYDAIHIPNCSNGQSPNIHFGVVVKEQQLALATEIPEANTSVWIMDHNNTRRIGIPAISQVDHWTCPPNGRSSLVRSRFGFISVYDAGDELSKSPATLLGSFDPGHYGSQVVRVPPKLTEDISDEITFHMYESIEGAIERFEYFGPSKQVDLKLLGTSNQDDLLVEYRGVCQSPDETLVVEYKLVPLEPWM